ncbi:MAG: ribonuclease PH [Rickettsiales bacterium]|jgi:ribonuclease PH|nr:ribonuclease PH [Rickettsiales bacterium]
MARSFDRAKNALRRVELLAGVSKWAEGSCLVSFGDTKVLCTATVENKVPPFLRGSGTGWVTAEYGMLPRATDVRTDRDRAKMHPNGRVFEISRLVGRALRSCVDMKALGERQVIIDCDVLQADGGTRTASVTGGFVALCLALRAKAVRTRPDPLVGSVSAVSAGKVNGSVVLDLDYAEDSRAETDANFVINGSGGLIEIQATAERGAFDDSEFAEMLSLAKKGAAELDKLQKEVLGI